MLHMNESGSRKFSGVLGGGGDSSFDQKQNKTNTFLKPPSINTRTSDAFTSDLQYKRFQFSPGASLFMQRGNQIWDYKDVIVSSCAVKLEED